MITNYLPTKTQLLAFLMVGVLSPLAHMAQASDENQDPLARFQKIQNEYMAVIEDFNNNEAEILGDKYDEADLSPMVQQILSNHNTYIAKLVGFGNQFYSLGVTESDQNRENSVMYLSYAKLAFERAIAASHVAVSLRSKGEKGIEFVGGFTKHYGEEFGGGASSGEIFWSHVFAVGFFYDAWLVVKNLVVALGNIVPGLGWKIVVVKSGNTNNYSLDSTSDDVTFAKVRLKELNKRLGTEPIAKP